MYQRFLLVLLAASTSSALSHECPATGEHRLLPHEDCARYYQCEHRHKVVRDCAPGTYFDYQLQICNWPHLVDCHQERAEPAQPILTNQGPQAVSRDDGSKLPNGCPADFGVQLLLPHETECAKFYSCSNGRKYLMSCGAGTVFDVHGQICNWPYLVNCDRGSTTTISSSSEAPITKTTGPVTVTAAPNDVIDKLPNGCPVDYNIQLLVPHEYDCESFYSCSNGMRILLSCPGGTLFDVKEQICNWPHLVSCPVTTTKPSTTSVPLTTTTSTETPLTTVKDITISVAPTTMSSSEAPSSNSPTSSSSQKPTTLEQTTKDSFRTTSIVEVDSSTTSIPEAITTEIPTTNTSDATATENPKTTNSDAVSTDSPTTTSLDAVNTDNPTTTTPDIETTDSPTTISTDEVTSESLTTTSTDAVTADSPITTSTDAVTTDSPTTTSTDAVTTDSPTTTSTDAVTADSPTTTSTDAVTTDSPTTTSTDAVSTDSPTTTTPNIETTDSPTTSSPNIETTDSPTTSTLNIETTDSPKTTTPDIEIKDSSSTTSPEATTLVDGENNVSVDITTVIVATTESNLEITTVAATVETTADVITEKASTGGNFDITQSTTGTETTHNLLTTESATSEWNAETKTTVVDLGTTNGETGTAHTTTVEYTEITKPSTVEEATTIDSVSTESSNLVSTTKEVESVTSGPEQPLTTVTDGTTVAVVPPPICPPGTFGNVPHPEFCNSFYMCAGGNAIQLFCTEGFEFDPELRSCVAISPGGCTLGSITTWLPDASTDRSTDITQSTTVRLTTEAVEDETQSTISDKGTTTIDVEIDQTTSDTTESLTDKTTKLPDLVTTTKKVELTTSSTEQSLTTVTDGTTVSVAPPPICPPGTFGNVPHPELCNSFYMCAGGNAIQLFCTEGFEFDSELRSCVAITPGGCTLGSITTWLPDVSTTLGVGTTDSALADTTSDHYFTTPSDGNTVTDKTTQSSDLVSTTKEVELTTSSPEQSLTTVTDGTTVSVAPPPICPPGTFGNVPHPELCNSFYMCAGGNAIQLFCTEGFEFDPELRSCVAISPGGCTLGSITTWFPDTSTDGSTDITHSVTDKYTTDITVEVDRTTTENSIGTTESLTDKTTESPDIVSTTNEVELTTVSVGPPPICSPGTTGNVPHPELCNSYYMCTGGNAIQLFCPGGFEYDPESWSCVPISPGGCTLGSITTSLPDVSTTLGISTTRSEQAETEPTTLEGSTITETVTDKNTTPFVATTESLTTEIDKDITRTTISVIGTTLSDDVTEQTTSGINTESTAVASTESSDVVSTTVIESTTSSTTATAPPCPPGTFGNVPHPELCNSFYMCAGGTAIQLFCTEGFEFDPVLRSCVAISPGGCTLGSMTTWLPDASTDGSTDTIPLTTVQPTTETDKDETQSTISEKGTTTIDVEIDQTTSDATESLTDKTTESSDLVTTTKEVELTTSSPEQSLTTVTDGTTVSVAPPPICPPGTFGNVPHPELCNSFYMCAGGNAIQLFCTEGFEFDPELRSCVAISPGGCTLGSITTWFPDTSTDGSTDITHSVTDKYTTEISISTTESLTDKTTESPDIVSTTKEVELTTVSVGSPPICSPGTIGNVPHPELCNSYYMCTGGNPIQLFCPGGFEYDPESWSCVPISPGGCTLGSITTSLPDVSTTLGVSTTRSEQAETEPTTLEGSTMTETVTDKNTTPFVATTESLTTEIDKDITQTTISDIGTTLSDDVTEQTTSGINTESTDVASTESSDVVSTTVIESTTSSTTATAPPCPPGTFGNVPHPELCNSFYMCAGGTAIQLFCTEGFEFDPVLRSCVAIAPGGCTLGPFTKRMKREAGTVPAAADMITGSELATSTLCPKGSFGNVPHASMCHSYYVCADGEMTQFYCSQGYEFDLHTKMCELISASKSRCSNNNDIMSNEAEKAGLPLCGSGDAGQKPHPQKCNLYYKCANGNAVEHLCTAGFEFDTNSEECTLISKNGCSSRK